MNTDALKTFLVLSELRSFRKTAQQLYIAQSTVSSRIQELERDLGQTLFDRKARGMTLIPAGHRLVPVLLTFVIAGGISNLIDRFTLGFVTDMISCGSFAVFNVADIAVTCGCVLTILALLILYREEE